MKYNMKNLAKEIITAIYILILMLISSEFTVTLAGTDNLRQKINFNNEWKFILGDQQGAEAVTYNDTHWDAIGLPHSFSIPYFLSDKFYVGYGWYRKHFDVPAKWSGKRLFLEFEGAFQDAEVFVNGKIVGRHLGGYTGFYLDITDAVKRGDNLVAVRLNNNWNPELVPRGGEHVFSGGIYRDVYLVVTNPIHVTWYGTSVTTPEVSKETATVNVKTEICNDTHSDKLLEVRTVIINPEGKQVASFSSNQSIAAGSIVIVDQTSQPIPNPELWHPDHPFLYNAVTTVLDNKKPIDNYETTFGIRWFKWTAEQGFFINGEHYYFKGVNAHQDHAGWGDAVTNSGFERDVKLVKDAGFNFIRGSHYPHDPALSPACDEIGVMFWSEACFWGTANFKNPWGCGAYPPEEKYQVNFEENVKQVLRDMIRIQRNHPSIVVWSMCNEPFFSEQSTFSNISKLLKQMVTLSHELDSTRPAAIGGCQRGDFDKIGDIAGYNGDGARLFIDPGIPNVVSEYGSTVSNRPGEYAPGWGDLQEEQFPWRSGQALWCAFDHGSIAGHFGSMGMVDYFRLPKRQWYWYRNEYKKIAPPEWPKEGMPAALILVADKTTLKAVDGTDDTQLIVTVVNENNIPISNCPPVTLTIESGPGEFPTGSSIKFESNSDIAIRDGKAAIEFRAYQSGKSIIRATSPGLKDAAIEITSLGEPQFIAGKTPQMKARPYVRYEGDAGTTSNEDIVLGLENPTDASSEAAGKTARFGNDGNPATYWEAANNKPGEWWQVDLERIVTINRVNLSFPSEGDWRYKIETSEDRQNWQLVIDDSKFPQSIQTKSETCASIVGRYVRITILNMPPNTPPRISEVQIFGKVRPK